MFVILAKAMALKSFVRSFPLCQKDFSSLRKVDTPYESNEEKIGGFMRHASLRLTITEKHVRKLRFHTRSSILLHHLKSPRDRQDESNGVEGSCDDKACFKCWLRTLSDSRRHGYVVDIDVPVSLPDKSTRDCKGVISCSPLNESRYTRPEQRACESKVEIQKNTVEGICCKLDYVSAIKM